MHRTMRAVSVRARRARLCRPWHVPRLPRRARWAGLALLVASTYYAGAQLGFALTFPSSRLSVVWPPTAFLFVLLVLAPVRTWWLVLLAVVPAHLLVAWQTELPAQTSLDLYATTCMEAVLAAILVHRFAGGPTWLVGLRRMLV